MSTPALQFATGSSLFIGPSTTTVTTPSLLSLLSQFKIEATRRLAFSNKPSVTTSASVRFQNNVDTLIDFKCQNYDTDLRSTLINNHLGPVGTSMTNEKREYRQELWGYQLWDMASEWASRITSSTGQEGFGLSERIKESMFVACIGDLDWSDLYEPSAEGEGQGFILRKER